MKRVQSGNKCSCLHTEQTGGLDECDVDMKHAVVTRSDQMGDSWTVMLSTALATKHQMREYLLEQGCWSLRGSSRDASLRTPLMFVFHPARLSLVSGVIEQSRDKHIQPRMYLILPSVFLTSERSDIS